jgi:hypothetical protein
VAGLGLWQTTRESEDRGHVVGLPRRRGLGRIEILPHGHYHEPEQYGVRHAEHRVQKTGDLVVLLALAYGHRALDDYEASDRRGHEHRYEDQAENYVDRRTSSLDPCQF